MCVCVCVCVAQSCLTLRNLMDCSPSGSSVHGILWARILEWVAISFSNGNIFISILQACVQSGTAGSYAKYTVNILRTNQTIFRLSRWWC